MIKNVDDLEKVDKKIYQLISRAIAIKKGLSKEHTNLTFTALSVAELLQREEHKFEQDQKE